jgi:two-component system alkaline phosphatase synthesis response regulator PhoP
MRTQEPEDAHQFGQLRIDLRGTEVSRDGKNVPLSAREFQLLRYLVENRGKTVSRGELLKEVWGYNAATYTRTVDMHIASLRQKIEDDPKQPQLVVTVPGLGYKFASA